MALTPAQKGRWRHFIDALRAQLPPSKRLEIDTGKAGADHAACIFYPDHIKILIGQHLSWDARVDALVHEWAHALDGPDHCMEHGPSWGKHFARCYKVIEKIREERGPDPV